MKTKVTWILETGCLGYDWVCCGHCGEHSTWEKARANEQIINRNWPNVQTRIIKHTQTWEEVK